MEKAIKFSIENKQFVRALKTATKVINRKNALPILSSVKLTMQDGRLTMTSGNSEAFITMQLVGESYTPISDTVSIRPSDIREFKRLDASYATTDYDSPAPFGYYSKTIHRPYTAVILWSTKQINVVDTVEQIQEKIQQNIERLCKIQAQILADAARKED